MLKNGSTLRKTAGVSAAVAVAALIAVAISAPTNAGVSASARASTLNISLRIHNNSSKEVVVGVCWGAEMERYYYRSSSSVCTSYASTRRIRAHGGSWVDGVATNPIGVTITTGGSPVRAPGATAPGQLFFWALNPTIGKPHFSLNGHETRLVEGEVTRVHIAGATVEYQRPGDHDGHKIMVINLISMG